MRTLWWAIQGGRDSDALDCFDAEKIAKGHHGRNAQEYIAQCKDIQTGAFRFLSTDSRVSIQSRDYCIDYDPEKGKSADWTIVSIHP